MNSSQLDPHISRLEYGNVVVRVDVGHGIDVNTANIRFTFTPSNAEAVTKVQAFIYDSCESNFVDSEKVEEDYLQKDYLKADTSKLFEFCINKYREMYSQGVKDKVQSIQEEIEEIRENQKKADKTLRNKRIRNKEKAEELDEIFQYILENQRLDQQIPLGISKERFGETDKYDILEHIYDVLGIKISREIPKRELTVSKGDNYE